MSKINISKKNLEQGLRDIEFITDLIEYINESDSYSNIYNYFINSYEKNFDDISSDFQKFVADISNNEKSFEVEYKEYEAIIKNKFIVERLHKFYKKRKNFSNIDNGKFLVSLLG